jgi:hypothetical protein
MEFTLMKTYILAGALALSAAFLASASSAKAQTTGLPFGVQVYAGGGGASFSAREADFFKKSGGGAFGEAGVNVTYPLGGGFSLLAGVGFRTGSEVKVSESSTFSQPQGRGLAPITRTVVESWKVQQGPAFIVKLGGEVAINPMFSIGINALGKLATITNSYSDVLQPLGPLPGQTFFAEKLRKSAFIPGAELTLTYNVSEMFSVQAFGGAFAGTDLRMSPDVKIKVGAEAFAGLRGMIRF